MSAYVWIDPPGDDPGTIHEVHDLTPEAVADIVAGYDIPEDNDDRRRAHDEQYEGSVIPQAYQQARDFWGVTVLHELPDPLPEGLTYIGAGKRP